VTWIVTAVIVTFAICWLPLNLTLVHVALAYRPRQPLRSSRGLILLQVASQVLAYANSCANPLLYAFMSGSLRQSMSSLVGLFAGSCAAATADRAARATLPVAVANPPAASRALILASAGEQSGCLLLSGLINVR